ncbi:MAG: glycosyltransferase family A protein, partial [Patescibacteria group bacterium]
MPEPKISIIIPVYNRAKELAECLESIRKNSPSFVKEGVGGGFEIIVVDDGSVEPIKIPPPLMRRGSGGGFADARVIRQSNQGAPSARNRGFKESSGEYVLFCDADVAMKPHMLARMSQALDENPGASYVYSSFTFGWKKFKLWEFSADKLREMPYIHTTSL